MEEQKKVNALLDSLDQGRRILFGVHMLKRLAPNYFYFIRQENFGDPNLIPRVIEAAKLFFAEPQKAEVAASELMEPLDKAAPDSEDYGSVYSTYALDACCVCYDIIQLIIKNEPEAAHRVSNVPIDTLYVYVQDQILTEEESASLGIIFSTPQIQNEITFQVKLIERLKSNAPLDDLIDEAFSTTYDSIIGLK